MDMHYVYMEFNEMTKNKNQFPTNKYKNGAMFFPINHYLLIKDLGSTQPLSVVNLLVDEVIV